MNEWIKMSNSKKAKKGLKWATQQLIRHLVAILCFCASSLHFLVMAKVKTKTKSPTNVLKHKGKRLHHRLHRLWHLLHTGATVHKKCFLHSLNSLNSSKAHQGHTHTYILLLSLSKGKKVRNRRRFKNKNSKKNDEEEKGKVQNRNFHC